MSSDNRNNPSSTIVRDTSEGKGTETFGASRRNAERSSSDGVERKGLSIATRSVALRSTEQTERGVGVAGSVGKGPRKEQKVREPAHADRQPLLRPALESLSSSHRHTGTTLWKGTMEGMNTIAMRNNQP
ncbi:hypothetical protein BLNAU_16228 [Blattamonas nauphoetae]|uniref:Uncharacterized protein n=1 Tax=Blattamonas nauphoetae TaxID=2049346 RepID=A0ABQ9XCB9_9EUKA|nr:hypothetical protein BLNAU_16228 [Blattamonas nauphoetae]